MALLEDQSLLRSPERPVVNLKRMNYTPLSTDSKQTFNSANVKENLKIFLFVWEKDQF